MTQYKDFVPEIKWFSHLFPCLSQIPEIIEERRHVRRRMYSWILQNRVAVINIETLPFEYGDGHVAEESRFRVWYQPFITPLEEIVVV